MTRRLLPGHMGTACWDCVLDPASRLPMFILPHHCLSWDSVFLPVKWVSYTDLDHLLGRQRLESGAGDWKLACVSQPSRLSVSSLKSGLGAEVSREGLFGLVDISEGCWASLVLWLSRHSRLPPGTKIRIPWLLAGPHLVFGKTPFCSFCCRRPKPSHGQMTVLPGLHSHALACIDLLGVN